MRAARTLYSLRRPNTSPPQAVHPPPLPLGQRRLRPRSGTTVASRLHSAVSEILLYQDSELISRPNYFEDEPGGFNTTCGLIVS
jgi:hypothetical protein